MHHLIQASIHALRIVRERSLGHLAPAFAAAIGLVVALAPRTAIAQSSPTKGADGEHPTAEHRHLPEQSEGTRKMVEYLRKIAAMVDSPDNALANHRRVAYLTQAAATDPSKKPKLYQEMLFAGMTDSAIAGYREILADPAFASYDIQSFRRTLGIAYLRKGEQDNCVANHTSQSCLAPIQRGGYHTIQWGSRNAIDIFGGILRDHSDDTLSLWLLNLAYMTLGEYPDSVPARWLIPPRIFTSEYDLPEFMDIAPALGMDLQSHAGGAAIEDFDNDGNLDVFTSSWGVNDELRYFRNNGDGTFTERGAEAGLSGLTGGLSFFDADYDNDGDIDIFITSGAWQGLFGEQPNSLLRNNGDGTFSDVTIEAGVLSFHPTQAATWGDFDNDGDLDLFVGNESTNTAIPCELYRNNGNGTFSNAAHEAGLDVVDPVKGAVWGDFDNDGLIDLYISVLGGSNRLMKNNGRKNGKWSFTDVASKAGVTMPIQSFSTFFFDYDNDGRLDIFVGDYGRNLAPTPTGPTSPANVAEAAVNDYLGKPPISTVSRLYHNNGDGTFTDVAPQMHLGKTLFGMGLNFGDLDNDGWLDIYVGTGHPNLGALVPNRMFRNAEGKVFQDVTTAGCFGHLQKGHGIAWGDIDNDGDQDIFATMGGAYEGDFARLALFQNPGNRNHWITLLLEGVKANRMGVGGRITVTVERADGTRRDIYATVGTGGSFGVSSLQQEIGLGDAVRIASVAIDWPGSHTMQTIANPQMDCALKVREGSEEVVKVERRRIPMPSATAEHHHEHGDMPMHHMHGE